MGELFFFSFFEEGFGVAGAIGHFEAIDRGCFSEEFLDGIERVCGGDAVVRRVAGVE